MSFCKCLSISTELETKSSEWSSCNETLLKDDELVSSYSNEGQNLDEAVRMIFCLSNDCFS